MSPAKWGPPPRPRTGRVEVFGAILAAAIATLAFAAITWRAVELHQTGQPLITTKWACEEDCAPDEYDASLDRVLDQKRDLELQLEAAQARMDTLLNVCGDPKLYLEYHRTRMGSR